MKISRIKLPQLSSTRIPQLYYGPSGLPRTKSEPEKRADQLFVILQIISFTLFVLLGVIGYYFFEFYGLALFALLGYLIGVWMRRSMGMRGLKSTTGFFKRMRERASGSKAGLLEWLLEKVSHHEFTQAMCQAVTQVYDKAVKQLKQSKSPEEQNRILAELEKTITHILQNEYLLDESPSR
jgi:hypothetical protein